MDTVGIRGREQPLVEKLSSSVSYLTVSFHLTKPQTSITAGDIHSVWHNTQYIGYPGTVSAPPWAVGSESALVPWLVSESYQPPYA